ncbi:hypothetical protein [Spiroplasma tabanidicola]|uniref:Uncharacterized protein n=1 Tax=Spiroplasma tabanidicola TaxID=324079 RepID=A0A6I6CHD5_9MOLU|nr:hypothetical protein [Spiroplasma tabanidicola]QGS51443.1 hypothetical protein STABA_v1c00760 [Spiroplasma tabanidicola]
MKKYKNLIIISFLFITSFIILFIFFRQNKNLNNLDFEKQKTNSITNKISTEGGFYPTVHDTGFNSDKAKWIYIDRTDYKESVDPVGKYWFSYNYGQSFWSQPKLQTQSVSFDVYSFEYSKYSYNKDDFWRNYNSVSIKFDYTYNFWDGAIGWGWFHKPVDAKNNKANGFDPPLYNESYNIKKSDIGRSISSGYLRREPDHDKETLWYELYIHESGNRIIFTISLYGYINWSNSGNNHACFLSFRNEQIDLYSTFKWGDYFNKLNNNTNYLGKGKIDNYDKNGVEARHIKVSSSTTTNINDSSVYQKVKEEVENRIVNCFDGQRYILDYLYNSYSGGKTSLEITIPKQSSWDDNGNKPYALTQFTFNTKDYQQIRQEKWTFKTYIDFSLSADFWNKNIAQRITWSPGNIIDRDGITVVQDKEEVINSGGGLSSSYNGGKIKFHTTVGLSFAEKKTDPNSKDYDHISINGQQLNGYNGFYSYTLEHLPVKFDDGQIDKTNSTSYEILIVHDKNPNILGDQGGKYSITIIIENSMDTLDLTMMNWNSNNPDFEKLTSPTITNKVTGDKEDNPNYDPTINPLTGTREQLIWVNKPSKKDVSFELDPVSSDNYKIDSKNKNDYEQGYIALASEVGGVGFSNSWNNETFNSVSRWKIDTNLETSVENDKNVYKVNKNDTTIQTYEGLYHFVIETKTNKDLNDKKNPPFFLQKFMYVNKKYGDFIEDINEINQDRNLISSYWSTSHGNHLRNYMINYKGWNNANSEDFMKLSYEGVIAYWRNYVSDIRQNKATSDPSPDKRYDIKDLNVHTLKFGFQTSTSEEYKLKIQEKVKKDIIWTSKIKLTVKKYFYC